MECLDLLKKTFPNNKNLFKEGKILIIILGCFGDFDSIEYAQSIYRYLNVLKDNGINLFILGIGNSKSKTLFSSYTGIPEQNIEYVQDNKLHLRIKLSYRFYKKLTSMINILLMCAGINSNGTLKEVLRGYLGDKTASPIISDLDYIRTESFIIKTTLFRKMSNNRLLPFELATIRLNNMIEIILNWKNYIPNSRFLVQRGGTFLYNSKDELIYSFYAKALLLYSETMNKPLSYIEANTEINLGN